MMTFMPLFIVNAMLCTRVLIVPYTYPIAIVRTFIVREYDNQ